ncbi:hypothetical protein ACH4ZU_08360 [Streptomyces sp. NPDC020472]|uniref:hypothetical protein n=1 Tax=Streptomyces sp. NPDC020472 TaxID=3365075 RepID=UPI003788344E
MGLVDRPGPGIEKQANQAAETACELTDATAGYGWNAAAADDFLVAIDTLAAALTRIDPEAREAQAPRRIPSRRRPRRHHSVGGGGGRRELRVLPRPASLSTA